MKSFREELLEITGDISKYGYEPKIAVDNIQRVIFEWLPNDKILPKGNPDNFNEADEGVVCTVEGYNQGLADVKEKLGINEN